MRWSFAVLAGLAGIALWVVYKGQNPDPELFKEPPGQERRAEDLGGQAAPGAGSGGGSADVSRGPLPEALAPEGWVERNLSVFGPDNLYEKINGREGFYKALGFERLFFLTLEKEGDASVVVDIELYDLGAANNALGAFAGEMPEGASPDVQSDGLSRIDRNALYVARGRHYARAVAADETEEIRSVLEELEKKLKVSLEGEPLPWSFALYVGQMGLGPGDVSFAKENAFSFGFATEFHIAKLGEDLEVFVAARADEAKAKALASQLEEGWMSYGEKDGPWVKDRYLSQLAGARSKGRITYGLRGAADKASADATLARLDAALAGVGDEVLATAEAPSETASDSDEEDEE
jgi:hypothetical protein